jgi:butyrate kinase
VDAILLTGGLARSEYVVSRLRKRISFIAPIRCFPGEDEMEALALNALAVLRGKRQAKVYE